MIFFINIFSNCKTQNRTEIRVSEVLNRLYFVEEEQNKDKFALNPIIRLLVFRIVKGLGSYRKINKYFKNNEKDAFLLGFYKDENDKLDLPAKRTYNFYLNKLPKEERMEMYRTAENILKFATNNNVLLDLEIIEKAVKKQKEDSRLITNETIKLVKKLVYPNIDLKLHHNAKFSTKDFLDVLVHVSSQKDFTNNGANSLRELTGEDKTPSGDLMMYHFNKFESHEAVKDIFARTFDVIMGFAKDNYKMLNQRFYDIAFDVHKICFYGKSNYYVCNGKEESGTTKFFEFLSCSIVEAGTRFILDAVPVSSFDDLSDLMDKMLERIKKMIKVNYVYCDRGFNRVKIFRVLKKHNVKFLMPMVRSPTVKKAFDKAEFSKAEVFNDFQIGKKEGMEKVNLVIVNAENGDKQAFVCNFAIQPDKAYFLYNLYSKRWGIECSYKNLTHDFRARTTSTNYNIRLFYFLFSTCLYNLWVLTNLCVSLALHGRFRGKLPITAKLFVIILRKVQAEYEDNGG